MDVFRCVCMTLYREIHGPDGGEAALTRDLSMKLSHVIPAPAPRRRQQTAFNPDPLFGRAFALILASL
jgi:hypothetical protein